MNDQHIRSALKVAECGSLTAAAAQLFVSVQGLKKQIDTLEREFGCTLFTRTNKGVALTKAGEVFYEEAPVYLSHVEGLLSKVRETETKTCTLRVAIWESKQIPILDTICSEYYQLHPDDSITFVPTSTSRYIKDVEDGTADLGFYASDDSHFTESGLQWSSCGIIMSYLCVMMPNASLAQENKPLTLEKLVHYRLALADRIIREPFIKRSGLHFETLLTFDRYQIMNYCMLGGLCICDEYLAASLPELVSRSLPWLQPIEIFIGYKPNPPIQVFRFIEAARRVVSRADKQPSTRDTRASSNN